MKLFTEILSWITDEIIDILVSTAFYFSCPEYREVMDKKRKERDV